MPEKFLILGASSFYGSTFAKYVEGRGDVAYRMWHRPENGHPGWDIDDYEYGEIGSAPQVAAQNADYVVNFISRSLVAESWNAPSLWAQTNVVGTTRLFDDLRKVSFKKFVHVSTPEVYGDMNGWQDESCAFNPSTPYAVSRAAGDMMLMAYRRAYGLPAVITRTANIYGPGQGKGRIIPLAFDTLRRGEKLLLHGGGNTVRSFIHVRDACAALYLVAKNGSVGQTYHISTDRLTSIHQLVRMICRELGKRPEEHIGTQPDRLGKDQTYAMKSDKIRHMGWRDTITLERGLAEYGQGT